MDALCHKAIVSPSPEFNPTKREVTSYKAIFGNVDRVREIVDPGAFAASIGPGSRLSQGLVPTRHNHETLVGKMIHAQEDSTGLLTVDKYGSDPVSDRVFSLVRDGILTTSSFTASYPKSARVQKTGADGQPVYHLTLLNLREAGPADPDFAVNDSTRVVSVKGLQEVATVLGNLSGLQSQEAWTMDSLNSLSQEDKDALLSILSQLPTGMAVDAIISALESGASYDASMGKALDAGLQLSEAMDQWKIRKAIEALKGFNPRRLVTAN